MFYWGFPPPLGCSGGRLWVTFGCLGPAPTPRQSNYPYVPTWQWTQRRGSSWDSDLGRAGWACFRGGVLQVAGLVWEGSRP